MNWHFKPFDALPARDLYLILQARSAIFVVEQNCIYQDIDGKDLLALHLYALDESTPQVSLAAYLRLLPPGASYAEASLGRVITNTGFRGTGLGQALMAEGLARVERLWPLAGLRISAQAHLQKFYAAFGFSPVGSVYVEDGVPHIEMLRA